MKNNYIIELQRLLSDNEIDTVLVRLMTQNFSYKQRIDNAIEYIENEDIDVCTIRYNDICDTKKELLNILRGNDNE